MKIGFEETFGIHAAGLEVGSVRAQLIASNLAHADTPGYKARDINFREVMSQYANTVHSGENNLPNAMLETEITKEHIQFRNEIHPSIDGNTVNSHLEYVEFAENAERYKASLTFLTDSIQKMMTAIKGGS